MIFSVERRFRDAVAVDETVVKLHSLRAYVWSAVNVDSGRYWQSMLHGVGTCSLL